ncbi:porin [Candidatus Vallotia lariciata]|uniref:porin n=1 Tax=Candidatus Vallotia laricis TaxID=2018052 RepID=UPI001D0172E6|nr:porin [Candidatus Vallotia lariciata]UDG82667.1 porin [Candidatus Vallotia lariciata]
MKRLALSAISLGVLAVVASAAHAQSSVTLYGTINKSLDCLNNEDTKNQWSIPSGSERGSLWGLSGSEDLSNDVRAVFRLENGFNLNDSLLNRGWQEFGRQAYVGLQNDTYGTLTIGRQNVPDTDLVQNLTAGSYLGAAFATPGDIDNYDNSIRVNHSIKYKSPVLDGLQFESLYAIGNHVKPLDGSYAWGAAIKHTSGPISIAASYQYYNGDKDNKDNKDKKDNKDNKDNKGANNASAALAASTKIISDSIFNSPINSNYISAASLRIARVASQYTIGPVKLGVAYSNAQYMADSSSLFSQTQKFNTGNISAIYQATPSFLTGIGYSYTKGSGNTSSNYSQVSFGANYSLSKRTDVYLIGAWQKATGQQSSGGEKAQAAIGSYGFSSLNNGAQGYVALGLRHKF